MNTGWNYGDVMLNIFMIINLLGNEYWLEPMCVICAAKPDYKPTGK